MNAPVIFRRLRAAVLVVAAGWVALAVTALFVAPRQWRAVDAASALLMSAACAYAARRARQAAELTQQARGDAS